MFLSQSVLGLLLFVHKWIKAVIKWSTYRKQNVIKDIYYNHWSSQLKISKFDLCIFAKTLL